MKRLTRAILHLYPKAWRNRYQAELEGVIEDSGETLRHQSDLALEGLEMRIQLTNWKRAALFACGGLLFALTISAMIADRFVSVAAVQFTGSDQIGSEDLRDHASRALATVRSRKFIGQLITDRKLDLRPNERKNRPLEDVIEMVRAVDMGVRIRQLDGKTVAWISYIDENPRKAHDAVDAIVRQLEATPTATGAITSTRSFVPATFPTSPVYPNRSFIALIGVMVGLTVSGVITGLRRYPRRALVVGVTGMVALTAMLLTPFAISRQGDLIFDSRKSRAAALAYLDAHPVAGPGSYRVETSGALRLSITTSLRVAPWRLIGRTLSDDPSQRLSAVLSVLRQGADRQKTGGAETLQVAPEQVPRLVPVERLIAGLGLSVLLSFASLVVFWRRRQERTANGL